jgi:phospholipase/carboxylesterase
MNGDFLDSLAKESPPGLERSASELLSLLDSLDIDPGSSLLGGFSQGSMVALRASLDSDRPPRGMLLFSSGLVAAEETRKRAEDRESMPFVQSHGTNDPILPYEGARALYGLLCEAGHEGRFISFRGGHAIPQEAVDAARLLLQSTMVR